MHIKITLFVLVNFLYLTSIAQKKCGTVSFNEQANINSPNEDKTEAFEQWMYEKIADKKTNLKTSASQAETTYEIPVVFHILHQGETLGTGTNIPDEQILSQVETLNEDFRRLNADASLTPDVFVSVAADVNIEFVLAKQDPEGLPTDGIVRVTNTDSEYSVDDAIEISSKSNWPSKDYLNIWVTDLTDVIGFAQYPLSNEYGLHQDDITQDNSSIIDGVYIHYRYVGTGHNALDFSTGRTLTHEIGHWLGLRHIWGDGGCGIDDYCDDTPIHGGPNYDCPVHPEIVSCGTTDMFQNYMDYTDDKCMNMFTIDQKERMRVILENSPRRKSTLTSLGKEEPIEVDLDLGIVSVSSPAHSECNSVTKPTVLLRNYGTSDINSFEIELTVDDIVTNTLSFSDELKSLGLIEVNLDEQLPITERTANYIIKITSVNTIADDNSDNDCYWINTFYPATESIPLGENFIGTQAIQTSDWDTYNNSGTSAWQYTFANNGDSANESIFASYYDSPTENFGEIDYFTSPILNLTGIVSVDLEFSLAYSPRQGYSHDRLSIIVSTDCGNTFPMENMIYDNWASNLSTTSYTSGFYTPAGSGDWQTQSVNFAEFTNEENVVIAFIGTNGGGNNIYIDDITISTENTLDNDISIKSLDDVALVSCADNFQSSVTVKNLGYSTLESYNIDYEINGNSFSENVTGLNIAPGKTNTVVLSHNDLSSGAGSVSYEVHSPNGQTDLNTSNNTIEVNYLLDDIEEYSPFKITFSNDGEIENWHRLRPDAESDWEFTLLDLNRVMTLEGYTNLDIDSKNYFVSPSLNLQAEEATLQFDLSYAYNFGKNDRLQILASNDCGVSFDDIVYDKNGATLSTTESINDWIPSADTDLKTDWRRESVDLSTYANEDDLRLAFVFTNQNGNNIYIDNLEMYHTNIPDTISLDENIRTFPNPSSEGYINVKFNYFSKKDVTLRLLSLSGKIIYEEQIENILNQIYTIDNLEGMEGIYILQTIADSKSTTKSILITK